MKNMFDSKKRTYPRKLNGFLIAEVLIASFVLTTGLIATTALITSSLKYSLENRDMIIAIELAQEGVELVRNVRDNGFVSGNDVFSNFPDLDNRHCSIDFNDSPDVLSDHCWSTVGDSSRYYLQYQNNFYGHNNGEKEHYSRYIYVEADKTLGQENALVRSFVYWGSEDDNTSDFLLSRDVGHDGRTTECFSARKCVYTEIELTNWK